MGGAQSILGCPWDSCLRPHPPLHHLPPHHNHLHHPPPLSPLPERQDNDDRKRGEQSTTYHNRERPANGLLRWCLRSITTKHTLAPQKTSIQSLRGLEIQNGRQKEDKQPRTFASTIQGKRSRYALAAAAAGEGRRRGSASRPTGHRQGDPTWKSGPHGTATHLPPPYKTRRSHPFP